MSEKSLAVRPDDDNSAPEPIDAPLHEGETKSVETVPLPKIKSKLQRPWLIGLLVAAVLVVLLAALFTTNLRYSVIGLIHKDSVTVTVIDDSTHVPLPDVLVSVAGRSTSTNSKGQATLAKLAPGPVVVTMAKHDYHSVGYHTTLNWSPVNIGTIQLHSSGLLLSFAVTDWVSGQAIDAATIAVGSDTGSTKSSGEGTVSIDPGSLAGAKATVSATGYNASTVAISVATGQSTKIALVPSGKVYFFSDRSGRIDLYSSNLDGSDQTDLLPGTGSEDSATGILPSITNPDHLAIESSRAGRRDSNGNLEHDLYIFDGSTTILKQIDTNVQFTDFRGWIGDALVYTKESTNGSTAVKSYNIDTGIMTTLATVTAPTTEVAPVQTSSYTDLTGLGIVGQKLYYSVTSSNTSQDGFFSIGLLGNPTKLSSSSVNEVYRQAINTVILAQQNQQSGQETWSTFNFATGIITSLPGEPASDNNRGYANSPDGSHSAFIETRDGNSQLYVTDGDGNNEQAVTTSGDVNQFVQWYGNRYVAFTTNHDSSAIYIVSISGGPEKKIADFFQGNGVSYGGGYNPEYIAGQNY